MAEEMARRAQGMPPETRAWFEAVASQASSPLRYVIGFCFQLVVGMVFAPLGGMLGASFFRKSGPPAPGGDGDWQPPPLP
jgi:hypothetical protein